MRVDTADFSFAGPVCRRTTPRAISGCRTEKCHTKLFIWLPARHRRVKMAITNVLASAIIRDAEGNELKAKDLWRDRPCVVLVLRRPGCGGCGWTRAPPWWPHKHTHVHSGLLCLPHAPLFPATVLCRAEALKLWEDRALIEAAGGRLVCVVKEWREAEVRSGQVQFV